MVDAFELEKILLKHSQGFEVKPRVCEHGSFRPCRLFGYMVLPQVLCWCDDTALLQCQEVCNVRMMGYWTIGDIL